MTISTVLAAGFLVAIVGIAVWMLWSLMTRRPAVRRGSGNPGLPYGSGSGTLGDSGYGGFDGGGCSGGDGGGGGGC
ncbi:hypothetical protein [Nonomuraea sp. NPDC050643]|uniref:hypothetical protein n=1 Tax=Nonomuraea sp. NPDC050643 TaxID=3155660 RepID=UPI0033F94A29